MKVRVGSFIVQNQLVKSLIIEECRHTEDDMDAIMKFFYEDGYKTLTRIEFKLSYFEKIPFTLHAYYPCLKILDLTEVGLKTISQIDLRGLTHLTALILDKNKLTVLPKGLFLHTPSLRSISFPQNELTRIDKDLLAPLLKLKFANFSGNKTIDAIYASDVESCKNLPNVVSLVELKNIIAKSCGQPQQLTISVQGRGFKVDRQKMAVHSSPIAKLLEENDEADTLELSDITVKAFKIVIEFIQTETVSWASVNPREVLSAARKLEMEPLQKLAEKEIFLHVTSNNAMKYLIYGNHNKLDAVKKKAFGFIRKRFPENDLPDRLINEPNRVVDLINAKTEMDDSVMKARQKFSNVLKQILE